ncbi:MAG: hypothetical protein KDI45_04510 [Candidatus Accumulibacter sp.]|nr:hypothetical protein [Accumulibacter sp.]MCB1966528.1 hypothetical protein [Accumulibacter sp.]
MFGGDTDWRQGDLITCDAAIALRLAQTGYAKCRVVVISHDCDLCHEAETFVEVIIAEQAVTEPKPDPNLSYAKNPRRLHLVLKQRNSGSLVLDLRQTGRRQVSKADFLEFAIKDSSVALPPDAKRVLKQWLAARYGRPAFPNTFEHRLRKKVGRRTVEQQIAKIIAPDARHLVGLFFDLGEQRGEEIASGKPYAMSISVVYDAIEDGPGARQAAERVALQIRQQFENAYGKADVADEIALDACEEVADTHMTLADVRRVDQWRLEYISLRDDDVGDYLPVGETPV